MKDFVTNAYTLRVTPSRDFDKTAHLFTEEFGRIEARVVSGRKPLSKFAPHLEPLQKVTVRLAKRSGFTVTDVLTHTHCSLVRKNSNLWSAGMRALSLIYILTPREVRDDGLWGLLEEMAHTGNISPKETLAQLGYDIHHAQCDVCSAPFVVGFNVKNHSFICFECGEKTPESHIIVL
ncbi:MAG: Uncharacterized protein LiPW41_79 [Parcubacteria group bacterium LiPW_41]|nr:MAG: Uncharacterized protein LiPW41_79 [Parcubacteria group bacterium LiPW_41]